MTEQEFWRLVESSRKKKEAAFYLEKHLAKQSLEHIVQFEYWFRMKMKTSYRSDLWGAAYVVMGGCSDDSFDYFRAWLILQGKDTFEKVVHDPEQLIFVLNKKRLNEEGVPEYEELTEVGFNAFLIKQTGNDEWDDDLYDDLLAKLEQLGLSDDPEIDLDWDEEDEEDLKKRYPVLWAKFGETPLGYED